jgi:transposase
MARPISRLDITSIQRSSLEHTVRSPTSSQRASLRARIILLRAAGQSQQRVAEAVGVTRLVVGKWEARFREGGLGGLNEARRSGRKPSIADKLKGEILDEAVRPPPGYTQWSTRRMAKAKGVHQSTVQRLWNRNGIKPHLTRTFKVSTDKDFEKKFWDVIGLYLNPPERALILCCDEKSQCQALERTQPGLPLGVGDIKTKTHDYIRHGTITLFAALSYLDGKIYRQTHTHHTHKEWLQFLKQLDCEAPEDLTLHLILDNYATHKHEKVKSWIKWLNQKNRKSLGHDRIMLHFTPTSSSWMNMVERFFRDLTVDCVRDGSFAGVKELSAAIEEYLRQRDLEPRIYKWKASGEEILQKIHRARQALGREAQS